MRQSPRIPSSYTTTWLPFPMPWVLNVVANSVLPWQGMSPRAPAGGQILVQVEKDGARNVVGFVFPTALFAIWQVPTGVDDPKQGMVELTDQPGGADEWPDHRGRLTGSVRCPWPRPPTAGLWPARQG